MKSSKEEIRLFTVKYGSTSQSGTGNDNYLWACNERENISYKLKHNIPISPDELHSFRSQLMILLTAVNSRPKLSVWQELNEHLVHLRPLSAIILSDKQMVLELTRTARYLGEQPEFSLLLPEMRVRLAELLTPVVPTLQSPRRAVTVTDNGEVQGRRSMPMPMRRPGHAGEQGQRPSTRIMPDDILDWFADPIEGGSLFESSTVSLGCLGRPVEATAAVRVRDMLGALGPLANDIVLTELALQRPLNSLVRALQVDLSEFPRAERPDLDSAESEETARTVAETARPTGKESDHTVGAARKVTERPSTGRQTAMFMLKRFHLRQMRVAFLNYQPARVRDFYALEVVEKWQAEPEHFIFSSFGIIHRHADRTGTAMSLTDWYREAVFYYALRCIPFVRLFLIGKYFRGWRTLTVSRRHKAVAKQLTKTLLTAHDVYGKALLQIVKLLDEVSPVGLVPTEFQARQTEFSFLSAISEVGETADKFLDKFFNFVQLMVNETAAELYKLLQFSQAQLHGNYLYSTDSIHLKNEKKKKRQEAMRNSLDQVYRLGNFVRLVNLMLNSKLVEVTLNNIETLARAIGVSLDKSELADNRPLFETKVVIRAATTSGEGGSVLDICPAVHDIEAMFNDVMKMIPQLVLRHCYPLNGLLREDYLRRYENILLDNREDQQTPRTSVLATKSELKMGLLTQSERMMENLKSPLLPFIELPKKCDDDLRVATPVKVNRNILNNPPMGLIGRAMPARFTPLSSRNVFEILEMNSAYNALVARFADMFVTSKERMSELCLENSWLLSVRDEFTEWSAIDMAVSWQDQSPYLFEQRIIKVNGFIQALDSVESTVMITDDIFVVYFDTIVEELLSEMNYELESISSFILGLFRTAGNKFITEINGVLKDLELRSLEVEPFRKVLQHIAYYRDNDSAFQKTVDYIKSLFDVLRITGIPINTIDKDMEEEVTSLWNSFMIQLREANDFVNDQMQNVLLKLGSRIQELEDSARLVEDSITGDKFSHLSGPVEDVLPEICQMGDEIDRIRLELDKLYQCYHLLATEQPPRQVDIDHIVSIVTVNRSIWELQSTVNEQLRNWKSSLFCQFRVNDAADIIAVWQEQVLKLRSHSNTAGAIIENIVESIDEFSSFLPFFRQLASPVFLFEHWEKFFLEIGVPFVDPYRDLTVQMLIDLDVRGCSPTVESLYNEGLIKTKAEKEFEDHLRYWLTREFEFRRHCPDLVHKRVRDEQIEDISRRRTPVLNRVRSSLETYHNEKREANRLEKLARLPITINEAREVWLVRDFNKIQADITDTTISVRSRKHNELSDRRYIVLADCLESLRDTVTVLLECQEKWLFLERIFEEQSFVQAHLESAAKFAIVNKQFLAILGEFRQCPIVLNHVPVARQSLFGFTDARPVVLVSELAELISMMDEIVADLSDVLDHARSQFPRLYFVSDYELIGLLSSDVSQDITNINRFIPMCFPAVNSVTFHRDASTGNGSGQAVAVVGVTGETLDLYAPLCPRNVPSQWLKELELLVKTTVKFYLDSCVKQQITETNSTQPDDAGNTFMTERAASTVFQEMDRIEKLAHRKSGQSTDEIEKIVDDIVGTYETWLTKYPLQVLLVTEQIRFSRHIQDVWTDKDQQLPALRSTLNTKRTNLANLLCQIRRHAGTDNRRTSTVLQNLFLLNDQHLEVLEKLAADGVTSSNSFAYQSLVKYEWKGGASTSSNDHDSSRGLLEVACFSSRFTYDYEYIAVARCDLTCTELTERALINMLVSLTNYEVGAISGSRTFKIETMKCVSRILGRNLFVSTGGGNLESRGLEKYVVGALMSGSLLYIDGLDKMSVNILSSLSKQLWRLRQHHRSWTARKSVPRPPRRRSSSPSRLFKGAKDDLLDPSFDEWNPDSERLRKSRTQGDMSNANYYDLQNSKLDKGIYWSGSDSRNGAHSVPGKDSFYRPSYEFQATVYDKWVDVRYGFGLCAGIANETLFPSLPSSLRCQLRACFMIETDRKFHVKQYLIMAGQKSELVELENAVQALMTQVRLFLPDLYRVIERSTPRVISSTSWTSQPPLAAIRETFTSVLLPKISNEFKDQDIFESIIGNVFGGQDLTGPVHPDTGLLHQIKSQIRVRHREAHSSDIEKIMELKAAIQNHELVVLVGKGYCGKSSAIDILVNAINNSSSLSLIPRLESKHRGAIDLLKSVSDERKLQSQLGNVMGNESARKIFLQKISLSNVSEAETLKIRSVKGVECPGILASLIDPIIKSNIRDKFQIWLFVQADYDNLESHISLLRSFADDSVKIIIELHDPLENNVLPTISGSDGLVQFTPVDMIKSVLEPKIKSLLTKEIISYYGSKYLLKIVPSMLNKLFKSMSLEMATEHHLDIGMSCLIQILDVLEIVLVTSLGSETDEQEGIDQLHVRLKTYLGFSVIQGARGVLYSVLLAKGFLSHDRFETVLRGLLAEYCQVVWDQQQHCCSTVFGLMIESSLMVLKPYHSVKGCTVQEYRSCSDQVALYTTSSLIRHGKSVFIQGASDRVGPLMEHIRYSRRLCLTEDVALSEIRRALHETNDEHWRIVSNEDILFNKSRIKHIVWLEDFLTDSRMSDTVRSLLHFCLEHKYLFDDHGDHAGFQKVSINDSVFVLTKHTGLDLKNFKHLKWTRHLAVVTLIEPSVAESRMILYRTIYPWISQIPRGKIEFFTLFSRGIADLIIDIGITETPDALSMTDTNTNESCADSAPIPEPTYHRITEMSRSLVSLPMDIFIDTYLKYERRFPIQSAVISEQTNTTKTVSVCSSDSARNKYDEASARVRIIRYLVFVVGRFVVDRIRDRSARESALLVIRKLVDNHFVKASPLAIEETRLYHYAMSMETLDIVMIPSRLCEDQSECESSATNYQPIFEAHSWQLVDVVQDNVNRLANTDEYLARVPHLRWVVGSRHFVTNVMKVYHRLSKHSLGMSSILIELSSCLVSGADWGYFLAGVLGARHVFPRAGSEQPVFDSLRQAIRQAGSAKCKVLFQLDSSCVPLTSSILRTVVSMVRGDNSVPSLLQWLGLTYLHQAVMDEHPNMLLLPGSSKLTTLSKQFLVNVQRNLKVLVTVDGNNVGSHSDSRPFLDWFSRRPSSYLFLEDSSDHYRQCLESLISPQTRSGLPHYAVLAEAHLFCDKHFRTLRDAYGLAFAIGGHHLQLCAQLYEFLMSVVGHSRRAALHKLESALQSVREARLHIDKLRAHNVLLQNEVMGLTEQIGSAATQVKAVRDSYGLALIQCTNQEKVVADLIGPLSELKEKSKSNLNDISPNYLAALDTIRNLDPNAIEEIKTYVQPPQPVKLLMGTIFYLLGYESSWQDVKETMVKINVYEELLYFDKDHISKDKYLYLRDRLRDPELQQDTLANISQAASSLSGWLHAVFKYHCLNKSINPQLGEMLSLQDKVSLAQGELGKMKVRAETLLQDLESKLQHHRELVHKKKALTDQIRDASYTIDSGLNLLSDLETHVIDWTTQAQLIDQSIQELPQHVIRFVVNNVYLARLPSSIRTRVFQEFQNTVVPQFHGTENNLDIVREVFKDHDSSLLPNSSVWHHDDEKHRENIAQLAVLMSCPLIRVPEFGSMIVIHNCSQVYGDLVHHLLAVLGSSAISALRIPHDDHAGGNHVEYVDCASITGGRLDETLKRVTSTGMVLVLDNVELLDGSSDFLLQLLGYETDGVGQAVHSAFRLVLVTKEMYSRSSDVSGGLLSSMRLLHYDCSMALDDVRHYLTRTVLEICQPRLSAALVHCTKQIHDVNEALEREKSVLADTSAEYLTSSDCGDTDEGPLTSQTSLISRGNLHASVLETDSRVLALRESLDMATKKQRTLLTDFCLESFQELVDTLCLFLYGFHVFPVDELFAKSSPRRATSPKLVSQTEVLNMIQSELRTEIETLNIQANVDPEISQEFIQKLCNSLTSALVMLFDSRLDSDGLRTSMVEYCIDVLVREQLVQEEANGSIEELQIKFIKKALLCTDRRDLLHDECGPSLDFIWQQANERICKQKLHLALLIENHIPCLAGLSKSLCDNEPLWHEYFKYSFSGAIGVPDMRHAQPLCLLHKAVLWRLLNPIKVDQVFSVLVAAVFGEDIFKFSRPRIENLDLLIASGSPWQPILLFTSAGNLDCTQDPLTLIDRSHANLNKCSSVVVMVVDCADRARHTTVLDDIQKAWSSTSSSSSPSSSSPSSLSTSSTSTECSTWLVLLNAHLYESGGWPQFVVDVWPSIARASSRRCPVARNDNGLSLTRLFVTVEYREGCPSGLDLPETVLANSTQFHCRPETNVDNHINRCPMTASPLTRTAADNMLSMFHWELTGQSSPRLGIACTITDLPTAVSMLDRLDHANGGPVSKKLIDLLYCSKIPDSTYRQVLNHVLTHVDPLCSRFLEGKVTLHPISRSVRDALNEYRECMHGSPSDVWRSGLNRKTQGRHTDVPEMSVGTKQHLAEALRIKLTSVWDKLHQIISQDPVWQSPSGPSTIHMYVIKVVSQILHRLVATGALCSSQSTWSIDCLSDTDLMSSQWVTDVEQFVEYIETLMVAPQLVEGSNHWDDHSINKLRDLSLTLKL